MYKYTNDGGDLNIKTPFEMKDLKSVKLETIEQTETKYIPNPPIQTDLFLNL